MNLLFTVCGRAGSKGVRGKNLRDFCGIPLICYTLAAIVLYQERYASKDDFIQTAVSSDSEELLRLAAGLSKKLFVIHRAPELAGDQIPKVAVVLDCLNRAETALERKFDMVVDLDITSPLRTVENIRQAIMKKGARTETDVVFSVVPSRRNPYFNMVRKEDGFFVKAIPSSYTVRQQAPLFYDMNASIYVYSPKALREKNAAAFFNDRADVIFMKDTGVLDIDSEEDYTLMQVISEHFYRTWDTYGEVREYAAKLAAGLSKRMNN